MPQTAWTRKATAPWASILVVTYMPGAAPLDPRPGGTVASRYLPNYLGWRWAVAGGRIGSLELLLRSALGQFPHLTVT